MNSKIKLSIAAVALFSAFITSGQTPGDDIRKINLFFTQEKMSVLLTYNVYPDSVSKKAVQSENGTWIKNGKVQYQHLGNLETLRRSGDIQLVMDHENKIAIVSNAPVVSGDESEIPGLSGLESVIDQCWKIGYRHVDKHLAAYDLYPSSSDFYKMTIVFEKGKYIPRRIVLQYAQPIEYSDNDQDRLMRPRIEVDFNAVESNVSQQGSLEFAKYLIKKEDNNYELTAAYKEYQLNNYLITN